MSVDFGSAEEQQSRSRGAGRGRARLRGGQCAQDFGATADEGGARSCGFRAQVDAAVELLIIEERQQLSVVGGTERRGLELQSDRIEPSPAIVLEVHVPSGVGARSESDRRDAAPGCRDDGALGDDDLGGPSVVGDGSGSCIEQVMGASVVEQCGNRSCAGDGTAVGGVGRDCAPAVRVGDLGEVIEPVRKHDGEPGSQRAGGKFHGQRADPGVTGVL